MVRLPEAIDSKGAIGLEKVFYCNLCRHISPTKKCNQCRAECVEVEIPDSINLVETGSQSRQFNCREALEFSKRLIPQK